MKNRLRLRMPLIWSDWTTAICFAFGFRDEGGRVQRSDRNVSIAEGFRAVEQTRRDRSSGRKIISESGCISGCRRSPWLLHTSQPARQGQASAEVLYLTSDDAGQTWTSPRPLFTQPGSFIRHPPVLITKSSWLLPMYYTPSRSITDGAESHYSAVKITSDAGKSWRECRVPQSNGLVQPSVVRLPIGRFVDSSGAAMPTSSTRTLQRMDAIGLFPLQLTCPTITLRFSWQC